MAMITRILAKLFSRLAQVDAIDIGLREKILEQMCSPRYLNLKNSQLKFYIHSITEEGRVRKFKEPWTIDWLQNLPNEAVLYDIGANIGITSLVPLESKKNIQVVAFEPAPVNFVSLVKNIQLNGLSQQVVALPVGLGMSTDIASFNLTTHTPGGAMHSFGDILQTKVGKTQLAIAKHYCLRTRLDDIVNWTGMPFPTHIKVDIDGGEMEFLLGAKAVLKDSRCQALQIEVVDPDAQFSRTKEVQTFMAKVGFSVKASYVHKEVFPRVTDIQFYRVC